MASNLDLSKLALTEPHGWETNSTSYRSASSVASGVSFSLVNKSRASPNHTNWARGPLKKFIINFVIAQKLAPLGTEWAKLYDEHPELYGLPRFTLPTLQCNRRTIITEHMTIRPSATLLSQFHPVPVWEELPDDHPACKTTSLTVAQAVSTALYEEYLEACAAWETTARMAIRQHTVDTIVTASREIPNDTLGALGLQARAEISEVPPPREQNHEAGRG